MERFKSTGLTPDDDWANTLNNCSFGRLTSSDDFGGWESDPSDSKYDDFEDEDEEPFTTFRKNKSEAWRPKRMFVDPREFDSRMEDLPRQQHPHKLAEVQRTSALLAKVKETLDKVVRMADNSIHETAAAKELLVAFREAFGSAESDGAARKPKDRDFINLQRLQDSGSESDSDFECFAESKLTPVPLTRIGEKMEIDVAVPGPSSAARPSPPQFSENAQTAFLNRLVSMMGGLDERITEFTTEVDEMERRVDERTEASGQEVIFCGEVDTPPARPTLTGHKKKKKKKKKKRGLSPSVAAPWTPVTSWTSVAPWVPVSPTSPPIPMASSSWIAQPMPGSASNGQRTWEPVVGREATQMFAAARAVPPPAAKKRKKSKGMARSQIPQSQISQSQIPQSQIPQSQILRPSKTAAVSLTAAAGRENEFGRAMARAMSTVKVDKLGIDKIRPKRSMTGGLLLEIPGAKAHAKATALKAGLEKALRGTGVRLSCPQKYAELRILGLTELATPKSVRKAMAAAGGCEKEDVVVGDLRRDNDGLFSAWARCPVRAAAKLAKDGQVIVHPFVAKVVALAQRPLQCHRCLEFGHVQHRCTSTVDRSNLCYRCGGTSHKAKGCLAAPRCPVCADLGVPANHRMGGPACNPTPRKMMTGKHGSGVAPPQAIPGVLPPETPTSSKKRKRRSKGALARERASAMTPPSEPPAKRSKISTIARAPLLATPKVFPLVAAAGAAPRRAALKASSPRACPVSNARSLTEMLGVALGQVAPGSSPSRTITVVTAAPKAKKLKVADAGNSVKPPGLAVQTDDPFKVAGVAPSVDAAPDVSLSVAAAGAEPGPAALQVSPPEVSSATNARTTDDTLALGQAVCKTSPSKTAAIIAEAPEAEKLEMEDSGGAVKSPALVVLKDALSTVAAATPSVDAAPDVSLSVAAAGPAPGPVALQVSSQGASPATNARSTSTMLAPGQGALGTPSSGTAAVITAPPEAEKLEEENGGSPLKPPVLVVQKEDPFKVADVAPSVDAVPNVSLSVAAVGAAPGPAALQVPPPEASPTTNARITDDTLALGQAACRTSPSKTAAIIAEAPEAEKLKMEDSGSAVKSPALVVLKDALSTVAAATPSVDAGPGAGPAALQVSSQGASPVTNARSTSTMLAPGQGALGTPSSGTAAVITTPPEAEKLEGEDGGSPLKPTALVVQKNDPFKVADVAPSVDAAPDVSLSVAAAGAAPGPAALQVPPPEASPATNARITDDTLALGQATSRTSSSRTAAIITTAPEAEKLEVEDSGGAVKRPALVVQKDALSTVAAAIPSVDATPDVSLSVTAAGAAPGQVALQVSPEGVSPATNAKTTCDMLALRQEAPGTTVVTTAALEPEKLGVQDGGCAVKPPPLVVQKDDEATVA